MNKIARVLVLTMYSGENEYDDCKRSVKSQRDCQIAHVNFENLNNEDAHRSLYEKIMCEKDDFDYFIKLDADTVLKDENSISNMLKEFQTESQIDHLVFPLCDLLSCSTIYGLHLYSKNVDWARNDDGLFVDPAPEVPGKKVVLPETSIIHADHMPNPSLRQSYLFGAHRALKIVQPGQKKQNRMRARYQFDLLARVAMAHRRSSDERRLASILGAEHVFDGTIGTLKNKSVHIVPPDDEILEAIEKGQEKLISNWSLFSINRMYRRFRYL